MKSVRIFLFGLLVIFSMQETAAQVQLPGFVRTAIKQMAKKYAWNMLDEAFCVPVVGLWFGTFDMALFDQAGEDEQVAMIETFISQIGIPDRYIARALGLNKSTVVSIRAESSDDRHEMAKKLAARLRSVNFYRNNWGKLLIGAGIGMTAATVGFAYYLNRVLLGDTQIR